MCQRPLCLACQQRRRETGPGALRRGVVALRRAHKRDRRRLRLRGVGLGLAEGLGGGAAVGLLAAALRGPPAVMLGLVVAPLLAGKSIWDRLRYAADSYSFRWLHSGCDGLVALSPCSDSCYAHAPARNALLHSDAGLFHGQCCQQCVPEASQLELPALERVLLLHQTERMVGHPGYAPQETPTHPFFIWESDALARALGLLPQRPGEPVRG